MARKHIIVEGPDGSGKDTLIRSLIAWKHWPEPFVLSPRASTSTGGPVLDLESWVINDLMSMSTKPPAIYNRHPLVSESIYSDVRRVNPGSQLPNGEWLPQMRRFAANHCVLVLCLPPFETVDSQARMGQDHMPGVLEHLRVIYDRYATFAWPGVTIRYNRFRSSTSSLASTILAQFGDPNGKH